MNPPARLDSISLMFPGPTKTPSVTIRYVSALIFCAPSRYNRAGLIKKAKINA